MNKTKICVNVVKPTLFDMMSTLLATTVLSKIRD